MAYRPHGRARVSVRDPKAFAVCDRCSLWYNLSSLKWQLQWSGAQLQNLRILVCERCLDVPQQQLRSLVLPPDPVPVFNPRPENFAEDNNDYRTTQDAAIRTTQDDLPRVTQETGDDLPEVP